MPPFTLLPRRVFGEFGRRRPPPGSLLRLDRDALDARARMLGLWYRDRQDAVLEQGLGLVFLDVLEDYLPLERAVVTLGEVSAFLLAPALLLAADGQHPVRDFDLDVLLRHARELGRDRQPLVGLAELDLGPTELPLHERREAFAPEAAEDVVEEPVHFAVKRHERIAGAARRCDLLVSGPGNEITNCHGFSPSLHEPGSAAGLARAALRR